MNADRDERYRRAQRLAEEGDLDGAARLYERLGAEAVDVQRRARIANDLGCLAAVRGREGEAVSRFREAIELEGDNAAAKANLATLEATIGGTDANDGAERRGSSRSAASPDRPVRVAILSFLFNWPARGGGNIHTAELGRFLQRAGYEVRHFYARYEPWGIGRVDAELPCPAEAIEFGEESWNVAAIRTAFRRAVDGFDPDRVIITDSWNFKPHLAAAVEGYPYLLRMQAQECLCPLNNLRLLAAADGTLRQCPAHQLASPQTCRDCLGERGGDSGALHRAERSLSGVGSSEYDALLRRVVREADAVLVLNRSTVGLVEPYARRTRVVTWGMDPERFPWPAYSSSRGGARSNAGDERGHTLLFAGAVDDPSKGFGVLHAACAQLWERRRDFALVATGEPAGDVDEFTRLTGWLSQDELPARYREAAMTVVPTLAREGLSRAAGEAMAAGCPVVASRIGGLPDQIADGVTGLLVTPGNAAELAAAIEELLDDPGQRRRMGRAGRRAFERCYRWPDVIEREYRPLLLPRERQPRPTGKEPA